MTSSPKWSNFRSMLPIFSAAMDASPRMNCFTRSRMPAWGKGAELYDRAMYRGRPNTWNLRDTHMMDTLDALMKHLRDHDENPKAIIWAHNSHLGDARQTQMGKRGEINIADFRVAR